MVLKVQSLDQQPQQQLELVRNANYQVHYCGSGAQKSVLISPRVIQLPTQSWEPLLQKMAGLLDGNIWLTE